MCHQPLVTTDLFSVLYFHLSQDVTEMDSQGRRPSGLASVTFYNASEFHPCCVVQYLFLFLAENCFREWMYHRLLLLGFLIPLSVEGYLDHFHCGIIVDKIAINLYAEVLMWTVSFL